MDSMVDIMQDMRQASMSQSFINDKVSVMEIMDSCNNQIGPAGYVSEAKQELLHFNSEKIRTDDAMERLKNLHLEYCDQLTMD